MVARQVSGVVQERQRGQPAQVAVSFEVLAHLHWRLVHVELVLSLHVTAELAELAVGVEPGAHERRMRRMLDSGVVNGFAGFEAVRTASSVVFPTTTGLTKLSHVNKVVRRDH